MKTSLSGIKPTGMPHLGNILGMMVPAIAMQKSHETFYFIADLHALTSVADPAKLRQDTFDLAAAFLALGYDPQRGALFQQSQVPQVTELMWMLSCAVSMGDLFRAHAYKAAKDRNEEGRLNMATFAYPVLMAADILLYDADVVPVGKDQVQHLEMARAIAQRFNFHFGDTLKEPKELVQENVAVIPGIDGRKMSKSYSNGIEPLAPAKEVKKQVMAIVTDSKGLDDVKDPDTCHIVALYKLLASREEVATMEANYRKGGYGYGHAKLALLEKIEAQFGPARKKFEDYRAHPDLVHQALNEGARKASILANRTLERARKACGIR
ncbi:MAG: tryptophan--tRNA ligase [Bdellovibrionales bacterium]|nr:tryptophan--tRNA ligase [Bdellovibrionales bacterium]